MFEQFPWFGITQVMGERDLTVVSKVLAAHKPQVQKQNGVAWGLDWAAGPGKGPGICSKFSEPGDFCTTTSPRFYQDVPHFGKQLLKSQVLLWGLQRWFRKKQYHFFRFCPDSPLKWQCSFAFSDCLFNAKSSWSFWFISYFCRNPSRKR